MKNIILPLIILFGIFTCNAQNQLKEEEKIRNEIDTELEKNVLKCNNEQIDAVTNFNGKTEF